MRIATSFFHQTAAADIQRAQVELFEAQRQTGSEKKADDLKGYAREARAMVFGRGFLARAEAFSESSAALADRLGVQDLALGSAANAAQTVRQAVTQAIGLDSGLELMSQVRAAFSEAVNAFNTSYAGRYLFSGVAEDTPPINISDIDELGPLPDAGPIFDNAPVGAKAQLDVDTAVDIAPLASDVGQDLFESFKRIRDYEATTGFSDPLTPADRAFLEAEIGQIAAVADGLVEAQAANGGVQQRVDTVVERQQSERDYFNNVVAELEDVDLAEVASRLTQAQVQMQASIQVYNTIREASVLNFLR